MSTTALLDKKELAELLNADELELDLGDLPLLSLSIDSIISKILYDKDTASF